MEDFLATRSTAVLFMGCIILGVMFEAIGDVVLKQWAMAHHNLMLISGLLVYFIGAIFWAFSLKYELLSKSISIFTILNLIAVALLGVFLFNEKLTLVNKLGILLGIVSVILIEQ
jgi:multidrug transporter EmrE-like cation transporter